jgi:hypothetical protein
MERKMDRFIESEINFIQEQVGLSENELKERIVAILRSDMNVDRAYLAQVEYGSKKNFSIALCLASKCSEDKQLVNNVAAIFRCMFGAHEHLDIIFLKIEQEIQLRKVCCPFYSSSRFEYPDFFLTSSEGYNLEDVRACYKEKRLINNHPDGYMLCEIIPPIIGQSYGLGGEDIHRVVLASRHEGESVFLIHDWPVYVHVAQLINSIPDDKFIIRENKIKSIGWAAIYRSSTSAALNNR